MWVTLLVGNLTLLYYRKNALLQTESPNNISPIDPLHGDVTFVLYPYTTVLVAATCILEVRNVLS